MGGTEGIVVAIVSLVTAVEVQGAAVEAGVMIEEGAAAGAQGLGAGAGAGAGRGAVVAAVPLDGMIVIIAVVIAIIAIVMALPMAPLRIIIVDDTTTDMDLHHQVSSTAMARHLPQPPTAASPLSSLPPQPDAGAVQPVATTARLESVSSSAMFHQTSRSTIFKWRLAESEMFATCTSRRISIPTSRRDLHLLSMQHQRWLERQGMRWIGF
mmetsp:Transcript_26093/g.54957  ORF Transcript_26093/g.54957 Transcript_26093/m.54957 type:complete len:211 (-) Transcript_26093:1247-1879(-)